MSDGAAEGGSSGKPLSAEEAALQAQARIDAAKAAWAAAAQAEVDAEAEMEAELGPTASGILAIEALAELPMLGYPTIIVTGSHGAAGPLSQDGVLGLEAEPHCRRRTIGACGLVGHGRRADAHTDGGLLRLVHEQQGRMSQARRGRR